VLGYTASRLDRAVTCRGDDATLKRYCEHTRAASYVIGGELVVLKAGEPCDPLFTPREARSLGSVREIVFLGLVDTAPRFGFGLDQDAVEHLKARNDLKISDLRSIAVQGMVAPDHLPPLAEAKALLGWHARHRF
jgi:NAD+ diphosphatase